MDNWNKNGLAHAFRQSFHNCLWLDDEPGLHAPAERWKTSVLRILLVIALLLCGATLGIVGLDAWQHDKPSILVTCSAFAVLLLATLRLSTRSICAAGVAVLAMIYGLGLIVLCFISDPRLADFGLVFLYTLPQLAWIFFGIRWALALMVLNVVPLLLLISGVRPPAAPFGIDMLVPSTHGALHALLFVFFNVALPLAFFRILGALKTAAKRNARSNQRLQDSNALYRDMFECAAGVALICDPEGRVLQANGKAQRLFGRTFEQTVRLDELLSEGSDAAQLLIAQAKANQRAEGDFTATGADGEELEVRLTVTALGTRMSLLVLVKNLSPIRKIQREIAASRDARERLASHDPLTDLPNRAFMHRRLRELVDSHTDGQLIAVASIRLKNARSVNERYGQAVGDQLIRAFSTQLRGQASATVTPYRLHGVVFSVVITGAQSPEELQRTVAPLSAALNQPVEIDGDTIAIDTAMGVAFSRGDLAPDELIRRSEQALEAARNSAQNSFMLFDEDFAREARRKIEIEMALGNAIERSEFSLVYQPKVAKSGEISGLEALLRWHSPELGEISPVEFIPLAERTGRIHAITQYVIDAACRQQRQWLDRHGTAWPIAINLSGIDLQRDNIARTIVDTTTRYGIEPRLLQIEITETGLIENDAVARDNLEYLLGLGFQIAIDDFGTGYSSLKKLSDYPINTIKIDRSFVIGIGENPRSEQIIGLILTLAKYLQCEVVAEGVETDEQLYFLHEHGCQQFQGYLFFKPLTAIAVGGLLSASTASPVH